MKQVLTVVAVMLLLAMPCRAAGEPEQVEGLDELWQAAESYGVEPDGDLSGGLSGLAEQALASGQQLPENFFKEAAATDIRSKGINNIFVGIGLFIFLWAITGEFGLGCIGLLVMFTGFGQLVIFYSQQKKLSLIHI